MNSTYPTGTDDDFTDIELADFEESTDIGFRDQAERVSPAPTATTATESDAPAVPVQTPDGPSEDAVESPATEDHLDEARAIAAQLRTLGDELAQLDEAELSDHVEYYQRSHGQLQRALSDIDNA